MENYMKKPGFLCDSEESATAASQVVYVVFVLIILNVSVESGDALIDNMDLILRMPSNRTPVLFQRKTRC